MMARGVASATLILLVLALAHQGESARPGRSMTELDLAEESRLVAQLRFEAGDPACGRFRSQFRCSDVPPSSLTPSTLLPQESTAFVAGAPVLLDSHVELSDCGPLGKHKFRCVPPTENTSPLEVAPVFVDPSRDLAMEVHGPDSSDCGPLGKHKFRCVPPMKTADLVAVSPVVVNPSVEESRPDQSDCGPLGKDKFRCVPPMH